MTGLSQFSTRKLYLEKISVLAPSNGGTVFHVGVQLFDGGLFPLDTVLKDFTLFCDM